MLSEKYTTRFPHSIFKACYTDPRKSFHRLFDRGEDTLPLTDTTERRPSHVHRRQRRQEGDEEAREGDQGIYERGTRRDEGARPRTESGQGGRGKRRAREDRRDAGTGSHPRRAAPCDYQSQRASPLAQALVRDVRL